jgi:hypothetical protein
MTYSIGLITYHHRLTLDHSKTKSNNYLFKISDLYFKVVISAGVSRTTITREGEKNEAFENQ